MHRLIKKNGFHGNFKASEHVIKVSKYSQKNLKVAKFGGDTFNGHGVI